MIATGTALATGILLSPEGDGPNDPHPMWRAEVVRGGSVIRICPRCASTPKEALSELLATLTLDQLR